MAGSSSSPEAPSDSGAPPASGAHQSGRRLFVGDLQGCADEFEELLESARFDPALDVLHPVGDLVNRGPASLRCLRLCRELGAQTVLGNHDLHLLGRAAGTRKPSRGDTLDEVLQADDAPELLAWLAEQPLLRVHPDLYQVHAGLHPDWSCPADVLESAPKESQRAGFATRVRLCAPDGSLPPKQLDPDEAATRGFQPWDDFFDPGRHAGRRVVFGHWAQRGFVENPRAIGLDTGCVWGGSLTAWCPETDERVSVPARRVYCRIK